MAASPSSAPMPAHVPSPRPCCGKLHGNLHPAEKPLKEATGTVYLVLEGVTFEPGVGNEAQLYLVDAASTAKELKIDPSNYVGSAANVAGGKVQAIDITLEINDFKTADKEFKTRTHFRTMDQAFLALVVTRGKVQFRSALITTEPPAARKDAGKSQPASP